MSDLLQITMPVTPKNYTNFATKPIVQNDQVFDLVDLSKVLKTSDRAEQFKQENSTFAESNGIVTKIPMLIAKDPSLTASSLRMLLANETVQSLLDTGNGEFLDKLGDFAKEILLTPNEILRDILLQNKENTLFNGPFFDLLRQMSASTTNADIKTAIASVLKGAVGATSGKDILNSLSAAMTFLADELSPSHNLADALRALSARLAAPSAGENFPELKDSVLALMKDVGNSLLLTQKTKNMLPLITHTLSRYSSSADGLKASFQGMLDLLSNAELKSALGGAFKDFIASVPLSDATKAGIIAGYEASAETLAARSLAAMISQSTAGLSEAALTKALSGASTLEEVLNIALGGGSNGREEISKLMSGFNEGKDLNALLDKLSLLLNSIDRMDIKIPIAQKLNSALATLSAKEGINYEPPSSMDNLVTFLSKNINDAALRSLSAFNQSDLVASLLTAPGVFTPLLHYLVPLQVEDTRAFGELWVDNGASDRKDGEEDDENHLFLSFTVERIGEFELEVFTKNSDLTLNLFCPPELTKSFGKLKEGIARIVAGGGYTPKSTTIGPLLEKRSLIDVFPRIKEKRLGFNVAI